MNNLAPNAVTQSDPNHMPDLIGLHRARQSVAKESRMSAAVIGAITVAGLYFARDVLIPIAVAVVISFVLSPLVALIERAKVGRFPAVLISAAIAIALLGGLVTVIGGQLSTLAADLPSYRDNMSAKIRAVRGSAYDLGFYGRASGIIRQLGDEIAMPEKLEAPTPKKGGAPLQTVGPTPVVIQDVPSTPLQVLKTVLVPLLQPFATAGIVVIFVVFFLLQREDIRSRFIRLLGTSDIQLTTAALDDAGRRLSRYLLTQASVNAVFGVVVSIGLGLIGVPNPILWGVLAAFLRFVPYVGSFIAAIIPSAVAIAVDPGWTMVGWTLVLFLTTEPIIGHAIEPVLYGHTTGLSPVAVIVAITFWTWLWGPAGLLLSTPLTLCLVVVGRHVERLEFLNILLGDQPPLTPAQTFYHHILTGNTAAVIAHGREYKKTAASSDYSDKVVVEALTLAQSDIDRGRMDVERRAEITATMLELVDEFESTAGPSSAATEGTHVLCVAGRTPFDQVTSQLLANALVERGVGATVLPQPRPSTETIDALKLEDIALTCVSYTGGEGYVYARSIVKRLRDRAPQMKIMLGLWGMNPAAAFHSNAREEIGVDSVATTIKHAADSIASLQDECSSHHPTST